MTKLLLLMTGLALLASSSSANAGDKDKHSDPADPEKKVCRRMTPTGSIRPVRICHPASVWQQMDAMVQVGTDRWNDSKPGYTVWRPD